MDHRYRERLAREVGRSFDAAESTNRPYQDRTILPTSAPQRHIKAVRHRMAEEEADDRDDASRPLANHKPPSPSSDEDDDNDVEGYNTANGNSSSSISSLAKKRRRLENSTASSSRSAAPTAVDRRSSRNEESGLESCLRTALTALQPTKDDVARRRWALEDLAACLGQLKVLAQLYGSSRTGLALPWSDIDVFACELPPETTPRSFNTQQFSANHSQEGAAASPGTPMCPSPNGTGSASPVVPLVTASMLSMSRRERDAYVAVKLNKILRALRGRNSPFTSITPIRHARVPIIKCQHAKTGVEVDCSLSVDGLATSDYLNAQLALDGMELARPLIVLVKALLEKNGMNDPSVGGLGSFATSLMVLWYLRSEVRHYPQEQANSIAVTFIGFLQYYGSTFDYKRTGIDALRLRLINKPPTTEFVVMNPIDPSQNSAKACSTFPRIAALFLQTATLLLPVQGQGIQRQVVENQLRSIFGRQLERRLESTRNGVERALDPMRRRNEWNRDNAPPANDVKEDPRRASQWDSVGLFRGAWI